MHDFWPTLYYKESLVSGQGNIFCVGYVLNFGYDTSSHWYPTQIRRLSTGFAYSHFLGRAASNCRMALSGDATWGRGVLTSIEKVSLAQCLTVLLVCFLGGLPSVAFCSVYRYSTHRPSQRFLRALIKLRVGIQGPDHTGCGCAQIYFQIL